jgi:hypothetical protein
MSSPLEYHIHVRHSIPASLALLAVLALPLAFVSASHAQINGAPASVTSQGFGGRAINGPPASVTSVGPRGLAPNPRVTFTAPNAPRTGDGHHQHQRNHIDSPPLVYGVAVPYAVDLGAADEGNTANADADDNDPDYQGGPTIFDRRGSGAASYIPPVSSASRPHAVQNADEPPADPEPPQEPTLLVFKDGRKLELGNYAIIGSTLFDLTPGHPRRVALADLDLEATRKENDDRGVVFQPPPSPQAN